MGAAGPADAQGVATSPPPLMTAPMDEGPKKNKEPAKPSGGRGGGVRAGTSQISGALPPEVIHRIVRQSFDKFHACYEIGLRANPTMQGRVTVRFVIGKDGATKSANVAVTDLPDKSVATCVAREFSSLTFPPPDRGEVTVSYPIELSPGGSEGPSTP